jgi:carbamoyl-phosphate synthase large subunit
MKTILVSGASGIVGYGILRSLRKSGKRLKLIGTTIYDDSAAQYFCDIFEKAKPTNNVDYIAWLLKIIKQHQVDLIIPGIEVDMFEWAFHASEIEQSDAKIVLNNIELISLCKDKWLFYQQLRKVKTSYAIETSLSSNYNYLKKTFGLPFLLKPRSGFGSKGIIKIYNSDLFSQHRKNMGHVLMAQPIVGNDNEEYTTSAFCDGSGNYYASMTLKRRLSREGYTEKAEVVAIEGIDEALLALCKFFKPVGPTNFQFRKQNGMIKLLEINPRISSSTSIRTAFGYNENKMAVEYYLENKKPKQPIISEGKAVRYLEDVIFYKE